VPKKIALVLPGGGARSAYQAGALVGLRDLLEARYPLKFQIICGISGGAINSSYLASRIDELPKALQELWDNWNSIHVGDILDASGSRIIATALKLVAQLGAGGFFRTQSPTQLLDTTPLATYLRRKIDFKKIRRHVESGALHGFAVTATHYGTGSTVTFFDGAEQIQPWMRSHRIGKRARIGLKHVLASSAIPVLFPPARIRGAYYGDGGMRMASPLSPAIHLEADKVVVIGVRYHRTPLETFQLNESTRMKSIQLADISGTMLNSLFLDAVDSDLERMMRINQTLDLLTEEARREHPEKLRRIPVIALRPSKDLGMLATSEFHRFSWILRHFLRGLGASEHHGSDFISYLAFEKSYTSRLLELGYADVMRDRDKIVAWFAKE
jgi:NTE family protein